MRQPEAERRMEEGQNQVNQKRYQSSVKQSESIENEVTICGICSKA